MSSPLLNLAVSIMCCIVVVLYARRTGRRLYDSISRAEGQLAALGSEIGHLRSNAEGQLAALGSEIGHLRSNPEGQLAALGSEIGHLRSNAEGQLAALGGEIGHLRRNAEGQLAALGSEIGYLRSNAEGQLAALGSAGGLLASQVGIMFQRLRSLHHEILSWKLASGISCDPGTIVIEGIASDNRASSHFNRPKSLTAICGDRTRTAVLVILGQSNAANYGSSPYAAIHQVDNFNIEDGSCYHAIDPLLGATGQGANFATRLGDMLIERELFDRVIIAPIAVGGSTVEEWADGGQHKDRILILIRRLHDAGLSLDFILWQQGEANSNNPDPGGHRYRRSLLEVVNTFRAFRITAPFCIALASGAPMGCVAAQDVRLGQRDAANSALGTVLGPDADAIGPDQRHDGTHFNEVALSTLAALWAQTIADIRPSVHLASDIRQRRKLLLGSA